MSLSVRIFCIICIISNGLAKLSALQESENRDQIYYSHAAATNTTHQKQDFKQQQEISTYLDLRRSQRSYLNREQNYYQEPTYKNYPNINRNKNDESDVSRPGVRVFRTYGRGKAQVTRQGQAVNVPNEFGRNANKTPAKVLDKNENETKIVRHRVGCRECPTDQTVVASRGNTFAILPEPCPPNPRMWNHIDGPRPGNKIQEGLHWIRGYMGPKKKFCQYHYRVLVHRCEALRAKEEDTTIECSADNTWGSLCNVSCSEGNEPLGPTNLECREDLTWSNPVPTCKSKLDCPTPKVKANSKISCQTADMIQFEGDFIPNGSTCKFMQNEKKVTINCKDGRWKIIRKNKALLSNKNKSKSKTKPEKSDPCDPNPCENGGTCLKAESNKEAPICKCKPQTQGARCEMKECYYNICENDGLCFIQNEQRVCYCASAFSGDTCQYYNPK